MGIPEDEESISQVQMFESPKLGVKIDALSVGIHLLDEFFFLWTARYAYGRV